MSINFAGNIEGKRFFKWTALHHAMNNYAIKNVKRLIEDGESLAALNDRNEAPLQLATRKNNRKDIEEIMLNMRLRDECN